MNDTRDTHDAGLFGFAPEERDAALDAAASDVALTLALAAEPVVPPAALRSRLLQSIVSTPSARAEDVAPGIKFVFGSRGEWRDVGIPGVQMQCLQVDVVRRYVRTLVRMAPGSTYPAHRHEAVEETLLLAGDLIVEEREMVPGDYCIAERGSVHAALTTVNGATFVALACIDDVPIGAQELARERAAHSS